jgi:hypothetical protein
MRRSVICGRLGRTRRKGDGLGDNSNPLLCGRPKGHSGLHECNCGCGRRFRSRARSRKTAEWNRQWEADDAMLSGDL